MIYHINYSNKNYYHAQTENTKSALSFKCFDKSFSLTPNDLPVDFVNENKKILSNYRGAGYWLWKPFVVLNLLNSIKNGDKIFYTDSGSLFIEHPKKLLELIDKYDQDIIPFELQLTEKQFTKRDAFVLMDCDNNKYSDSKQIMGTAFILRKSNFSLEFFNQYLEYAKDERILTDKSNVMGLPNYSDFIDHRHDQSVFSLLCKKNNLLVFRDPSQYGNEFINDYSNSEYPQIININRNRKKNINYWVDKFTKRLPSKIIKKIKSYK